MALLVISVVTGVFLPGRTVNRLLKSKDEEIAMWKGIATERGETTRQALHALSQFVDVGDTNVKALEAMTSVAGEGDAHASTKAG
jgi:hypothetical protein